MRWMERALNVREVIPTILLYHISAHLGVLKKSYLSDSSWLVKSASLSTNTLHFRTNLAQELGGGGGVAICHIYGSTVHQISKGSG